MQLISNARQEKIFHGRPSLAPALEREALAYVLHRALLFIRLFPTTSDLPEKEKARLLSDLADALHNAPIVMERYEKGHDANYLVSLFFRAFDAKWRHVPEVPRLESIFSSSLEEIGKRDAPNP